MTRAFVTAAVADCGTRVCGADVLLATTCRLVGRLRQIMASLLRHAIVEQQGRGGPSLAQIPALLQAVELDASTPAKFSRHLIFPGFVVASAQDAGAFMRALAASPNMTSDVRVSSLLPAACACAR